MATTLTVSSNYVGKAAGEIIGKSFKEADTIQRNLISVLPDIDYQISLRLIEYSDGRQDYSCGFTPQGSTTLSEKLLTPKKIKNELEICKEDLRQIWSSATMGFSAHNDSMPNDVETALLAEILADESAATDAAIWQGTATNGTFEGFITKWASDGNIIKAGNGITSASAAITASNVLTELAKVKDAIPVSLRRKSLKFLISPDVADAYDQKLIESGVSNGLGGNANTQQVYGRYTLETCNGLPDNTFVVYDPKNLYFGTGLLSDHNEIRIKDMDESDLSGQVRYKMVYTAGVQYANSEDIVWYLSTT